MTVSLCSIGKTHGLRTSAVKTPGERERDEKKVARIVPLSLIYGQRERAIVRSHLFPVRPVTGVETPFFVSRSAINFSTLGDRQQRRVTTGSLCARVHHGRKAREKQATREKKKKEEGRRILL